MLGEDGELDTCWGDEALSNSSSRVTQKVLETHGAFNPSYPFQLECTSFKIALCLFSAANRPLAIIHLDGESKAFLLNRWHMHTRSAHRERVPLPGAKEERLAYLKTCLDIKSKGRLTERWEAVACSTGGRCIQEGRRAEDLRKLST
jgi:hypothetical protein